MIFCKAQEKSIARVMEVLHHFSSVTGLAANMEKFNFFCAGVEDEIVERFLRLTGFSTGTLLIRYLGLPLSLKKWNKVDCHILIGKITSRITSG